MCCYYYKCPIYPFVDPAIKVRAALDITEGLFVLFVADLGVTNDLVNSSVDDLGCDMACLEEGEEAVDESGELGRGVGDGSDWSCNLLPTTWSVKVFRFNVEELPRSAEDEDTVEEPEMDTDCFLWLERLTTDPAVDDSTEPVVAALYDSRSRST